MNMMKLGSTQKWQLYYMCASQDYSCKKCSKECAVVNIDCKINIGFDNRKAILMCIIMIHITLANFLDKLTKKNWREEIFMQMQKFGPIISF